MIKLSITVIASLFLSSIASANPHPKAIETSSLSRAALEINAMNNIHQTTGKVETHYSHESEMNNSLARGALARQGVKVNLVVNSDSEISYSGYDYSNEKNNSFYRAILAQ